LILKRIEEHAVDGEVAALGVLLGGGEDDRFGMSAIDVGPIGTEGGDLDIEWAWSKNVDDAKGSTNSDGSTKKGLHLLRASGSGDIVVFGHEAQQLIANATTREEGLVTGIA
jgi:hypothetical protein